MSFKDPAMCHTFWSGCTYYGKLDVEGKPTGFGRYRFPNGIEYQGYFKSGQFHGRGMIIHPTKFKMCGEFVVGKCTNYELYFADGLRYKEKNWKYCQNKDRRFWLEIVRGISPVGETFLTKEKPSRIVPQGLYDAEEGFFEPNTGYIYDTESGDRMRYVCPREQRYILRNYRMNADDFIEQEKRIAASKIIDISTDSVVSSDDE